MRVGVGEGERFGVRVCLRSTIRGEEGWGSKMGKAVWLHPEVGVGAGLGPGSGADGIPGAVEVGLREGDVPGVR